jgi:hypothetical protein
MILVEHPDGSPGLSPFDAGIVLGLLIGEGTFGGDGRQPHVVLRMHVRHEPLFRWLKTRFPYARLYGPYNHSGREYYQFMWRGTQLRYGLMPLLESAPWTEIDPYAYERYNSMKERYGLTGPGSDIAGASEPSPPGGESESASEPFSPE